jgi:YcaO-like protein with predicted kinase domain
MTREESRAESAAYLNSLSREDLFTRFQITRVANITGLDIIGAPVYSCCRPISKTLSVSAGKSRDPLLARAGAIAEGIEFHTFENPRGPYLNGFCDIADLPTMSGVKFDGKTPCLVEPAIHFATNKPVWIPSEMCWMTLREKDQGEYFMKSSNGQAVGSSFREAFLHALYEVVERDQVGLWRISMAFLGAMPPRVEIPDSLASVDDKVQSASLKLYLFGTHVDIPIPTFYALLVDPYTETGSFAGWGCHLSNEVAAERAILEAIQSRAVYISGARDDIARRDFFANRESDPKETISVCESGCLTPFPGEAPQEIQLEQELSAVLHRLFPWRDKIYYRFIRIDDRLCAVKVFILGLEHPNLSDTIKGWRSTRWAKLQKEFQEKIDLTVSYM